MHALSLVGGYSRLSDGSSERWNVQGIFVLDPRKLIIDIEIEIVIEINFWQLSDFDIDFDFDGCRPSLGSPYEHLAIYHYEIIESLRRTKMP
jgi:hypothetical protein